MRSLLLITLFTLALSSCKKEIILPTRTVANFGGCRLTSWADADFPLRLSMDSEFQALIGADNEIMSTMASQWSDEIHATEGLIQKTMSPIDNPQFTDPTLYRVHSSLTDNSLGIYKNDIWFSEFSPDALAVTQYFVNQYSGNIVHADIFFNFKDFGDNYKGLAGHYHYDIGTIALHELGHLLGICHTDNEPSVMNPRYYSARQELFDFDKDHIRDKYAHLTAFQSEVIARGGRSTLGVRKKPSKADYENEIRSVVELKSNGDCNHFTDGVLTQSHKVDLEKLK